MNRTDVPIKASDGIMGGLSAIACTHKTKAVSKRSVPINLRCDFKKTDITKNTVHCMSHITIYWNEQYTIMEIITSQYQILLVYP
jgi:hypothetical protein